MGTACVIARLCLIACVCVLGGEVCELTYAVGVRVGVHADIGEGAREGLHGALKSDWMRMARRC